MSLRETIHGAANSHRGTNEDCGSWLLPVIGFLQVVTMNRSAQVESAVGNIQSQFKSASIGSPARKEKGV